MSLKITELLVKLAITMPYKKVCIAPELFFTFRLVIATNVSAFYWSFYVINKVVYPCEVEGKLNMVFIFLTSNKKSYQLEDIFV